MRTHATTKATTTATTTKTTTKAIAITLLILCYAPTAFARPLVRQIRSAHEFDRLLEKHAATTGLPVIADFYSDGCGPCRQIAPVFQQIAKETKQTEAVFVKINTQTVPDLASRFNVRSIPTFFSFHNGHKFDTLSGASQQGIQQMVTKVLNKSKRDNVKITLETLRAFYQDVDPDKSAEDVDKVYAKCADMNQNKKLNPDHICHGAAALNLSKGLKKKYSKRVQTVVRFTMEDRKPAEAKKKGDKDGTAAPSSAKGGTGTGTGGKASPAASNLHLASKEELMEELEKRLDAEEEAREEELEEEDFAEFEHSYVPGDFPERVTIIGGGPAGMSAAIYAARAGLKPVVVAPPMGGQLQGKGVDVENYPGLANVTGPEVVAAMREQAAAFGAVFECEEVMKIDATESPFKVYTNSSVIETHAIIVATGAESNWLNIPGEYEMRGGGVSSCAICDGAAFYQQDVVVIGGGDSAMEEALVLARTSKRVTIIHRRDDFRASNILALRVMQHPSIKIKWNTVVKKIIGEHIILSESASADEDDAMDLDLDEEKKFVTGVILTNTETGEESTLPTSAVFVAIGHTPTTSFLENIVDFDEEHAGYIKTVERSTKTSVPGIFASGDVSDAIYRQAVTSAGSGAAAALDAERWLSEEGLGNEQAEFEAELLAELMADGMDKSESGYNAYDDAGGRMSGMKESARVEL